MKKVEENIIYFYILKFHCSVYHFALLNLTQCILEMLQIDISPLTITFMFYGRWMWFSCLV